MTAAKYLILKDHYEKCLADFGDSSKGVDWPNRDDAAIRYRVMAELVRFPEETFSLIDFGCGLSHFYEYLCASSKNKDMDYCGVDISGRFIAASRDKFPHNRYVEADILVDPWLIEEADYLVANGVFTEKLSLSNEEMWEWVKTMIGELFKKCSVGMACNFMSKHVDWEREDLFHLSLDHLTDYVEDELTKIYVVRKDYGLYEYTIYMYKNPI